MGENAGLSYSEVKDIAKAEAEKVVDQIYGQVNVNSRKIAEKVISEKASEEVIQNIKEEIQKLKSETRRRALIYFGAFLVLGGGFVWLGKVAFPDYMDKLRDYAYPGNKIYTKITTLVESDDPLTQKIIDSSRDYVALSSFPRLKEDIPNYVSEWDVRDFRKLVGNANFRVAFYENHSDIVNSILNQNNKDLRSREPELLLEGRVKQPVQILSAGELDGNPTKNCQSIFNNDELQAILVIPSSAPKELYNFYGCNTYKGLYWPTIDLEIEAIGNKLKGVRLVEVQRSGKTRKLQLRVSKLVAEKLSLPGAIKNSVSNSGMFLVHKVGNLNWDGSTLAVDVQQ